MDFDSYVKRNNHGGNMGQVYFGEDIYHNQYFDENYVEKGDKFIS